MSSGLLRAIVLGTPLLHLPQVPPTDIRLRLLDSAQRANPEFPDEKSVKLTHFGYLGSLDTPDGPVYVVDQRGVIAGMPSPRGLNFILFFDARERYLGKLYYGLSRPLWCEGGKLVLWGSISSMAGVGNVVDLSTGFRNLAVREERIYGSSGGLRTDSLQSLCLSCLCG